MFKLHHTVALLSCFLLAGLVRADDADQEKAPTLHAGDSAPALIPLKWVKGEAVQKFQPGKIYVVEFWATWCGPCKVSIPHLSKLQQQYPDVTFIGMDCMEDDQTKVAPFVEKMGDQMNYRVALDDMSSNDKGKMAESWLDAAGQGGIPCAFLVDKNTKIAWIGHPMVLEPVLKQVLAGTFDPKKEALAEAAREHFETEVNKAMQAKDFSSALTAVEKYMKDHPESAGDLDGLKYDILLRKKDFATALAFAKEISDTHNDDMELLNSIAWSIVDPDNRMDKPDLALAEKDALRAYEISKGQSAEILDTLARVYHDKGNISKAIELETQAIAKADDDDMKKGLVKTLQDYEVQIAAPK